MANKMKKLGTWTHEKSGIQIDYFIDGTRFRATVLEKSYDAPEASVLQAKCMDAIEHWMTLEWYPILCVSCHESSRRYGYRDDDDREHQAGLELTIGRFWLSRSPAGNVVKCNWDIEEEHRKAKMSNYGGSDLKLTPLPLRAPFPSDRSENQWLIDYDEGVWNTLCEMVSGINQMRSQVEKLFKSKQAIAKLVAQGTRALLLGDGKARK